MALISCPDCKGTVSDVAPACPRCGRPIAVKRADQTTTQASKHAGKKRWWALGAVLIVLYILGSSDSPSTLGGSSSGWPTAATPDAGGSGLTLNGYNQLQTGMSYGDVVRILGTEGTEISRNEFAETVTVMYQWESRFGGANMNAMFQDDQLVQKAQFGLR